MSNLGGTWQKGKEGEQTGMKNSMQSYLVLILRG